MSLEYPQTTHPASANSERARQVRMFVLIWLGVTLVVGAAAFVAIFVATGFLLPSGGVLPVNAAAAAITSPTPIQMRVVQPTSTPSLPTPTQAVALAAAVTSTPTQEPSATPTLTAMQSTAFDFGIQVQESFDIYDYWMTVVSEQLHLDWIKQQVRWENIEPVQGQYDWALLDVVLPTAQQHGVRVMLSIVTAPEWAREPGADLTKHGPPANFQNYVNFVTAILNRYPGMVSAIEVWNEMNIDREWASVNGLSTQNYMRLLQMTYQAVKAIDPGIIVISGALSPTGGWVEPNGVVSAIDDFQYMDGLIQNGLLQYSDCVGAHHNGYNIGPTVPWDEAPRDPEAATAIFRGPFDNPHHSWSLYSTLTTYANKIQLAGGNQRLCITEFGWAVAEDLGGYPRGFEFAQDNTLQEQADYIIEAVQWMEESDIVWLAWVWNLNYGAQAGWDPTNDNVPYSILRPNSVPAPAWDAIARYRMEHFGGNS